MDLLGSSGALLDAVPIAIVVHDCNGKAFFANREARTLLGGGAEAGLDPSPLLARAEVYVADTNMRYPLEQLASVVPFNDGVPRTTDMEIRRPDGTVHLEVRTKPTFSAAGVLGCVVHTFFDASDRKNTDADLRLTDSLARALVTEPGFADVLQTSLHEICQLTGWTFGQAWLPDVSGLHLRCRYVWHDGGAGLREFHTMSRGLSLVPGQGLPGRAWESRQWEWTAETPDPDGHGFGTTLPDGHRSGVAMPVQVGGEVVAVLEFFVLVGGSQDQRSRDRVAAVLEKVGEWMSSKGAEDAVGRSAGQFRNIAETATDAIVSAGADGRIIYMNPSAEQMFGYTADEILGRSMGQLVHDRSDTEGGTEFGRYSQVGRGGLMGPAVYLAAVSKDGAEFPVEMNLTSWQEGGETFLTAIVRDSADRVDAEQRLEDALGREREVVEQLHVMDGLKYTVLQTLAHDLRSPLATILTLTAILRVYADSATGHDRTSEPRLIVLGDIERSVRKMERLLQDLISSDPLQPLEARRALCDVGALVTRAVADSDITRLHPVQTDLAHVEVNVDSAQVERIVENLLNNAAKHLDSGVPVWVRTFASEGGGVTIAVEDAGTGVPAELRDQIFEPFRRGDGPTSPGLGLGLSLVSRFAQVHGGRAWVEERDGGGASFRVHLPDAAAPVVAGPPLARITVMICDDDIHFSGALTTLISLDGGLQLIGDPVRTGQEAIEAAALHHPDVVLMDVDLIGPIDGFQATTRIRELSPGTQVVVMSGAPRLGLALAQSVAAGAWTFVPKTEAGTRLMEAVYGAGATRTRSPLVPQT